MCVSHLQWSQRLHTNLTLPFFCDGLSIAWFLFSLPKWRKGETDREGDGNIVILQVHTTLHKLFISLPFSLDSLFLLNLLFHPFFLMNTTQLTQLLIFVYDLAFSRSHVRANTHTNTHTLIAGSAKERVLRLFLLISCFNRKLICYQITVRGNRRRQGEWDKEVEIIERECVCVSVCVCVCVGMCVWRKGQR